MIFLHQIDPIALALGPLKIHWYGLMYLLGFAAAWWLGRNRIHAGRLPGVDDHAYGDLMFYAMLGVVIGGRVGYILFYDLPAYVAHPLQVLKIWEGGMSFHGGLLGVCAAVWLWSRRRGLHFMDTIEFIAPLVPPGLGFGRLGNFINGELWGKLTHANWGVVFPAAPRFDPAPGVAAEQLRPLDQIMSMAQIKQQYAEGLLNAYARHPSQLYQFALEGLVLFAAVWFFSEKPRPRYAVAGMFALVYGIGRFLVEFVRVPDEQLNYLAFGWLTMGQLLSVPLVLVGLFWLWRSRRAPVLQPQPQPRPQPHPAAGK